MIAARGTAHLSPRGRALLEQAAAEMAAEHAEWLSLRCACQHPRWRWRACAAPAVVTEIRGRKPHCAACWEGAARRFTSGGENYRGLA